MAIVFILNMPGGCTLTLGAFRSIIFRAVADIMGTLFEL